MRSPGAAKPPARFPRVTRAGSAKAPSPFTAVKITPGELLAGTFVCSRSCRLARTLRLGHASAATTTSPPTIKASATAYCSPRRNPLVPSIGSRVQNRSWYCVAPPWSIQSQISVCRQVGSLAGDALSRTARTCRITRSRIGTVFRQASARRHLPPRSRHHRETTRRVHRQISAWLPKSATVTGLLSFLARTSDEISAATARHSRAASRTARIATASSRS